MPSRELGVGHEASRFHHASWRRGSYVAAGGARAAAASGYRYPEQPFAGDRCTTARSHSTGVNDTGFVEGRNVSIEYRWAEGNYNRLAALAADLVRRKVAVIVTIGGDVAALAAKAATATLPVVFTVATDPVRSGLVSNLHRPGGNLTGNSGFQAELEPKRLGLLRELRPDATTIGVLVNPNVAYIDAWTAPTEWSRWNVN